MQYRLKPFVLSIGIALLLLSPIYASAQISAAPEEYLASFGSFVTHFLGNIHFFGSVNFGSIGLTTGLGVTLPTVIPGSGWSGPTAQLAQQGTSGQQGFNDDVIANWDFGETIPYATVTTARPICVAATQASGIKNVKIALNGGAWVTALETMTLGVSAGLQDDYCAKFDPTTVADGPVELRAIACPNDGYCRILQSGFVASLTSGSPWIASGPHGKSGGNIVIPTTTADGFTSSTEYVVNNGQNQTGNSMMLSLKSLLNSGAVGGPTPYATSISVASPAVVTQTNAYAVGQPISIVVLLNNNFRLPTGLTLSTVYYACWPSGTPLTTSYDLASTAANAAANNCDINTTGAGNGVYYAWPLVVPTGSGTVSFYYENAQGLEINTTASESLFLLNNAGGAINTYTQYVDTSGTDPGTAARTACTTTGAPCATTHGALANIVAAGGSVTASTAGDGCALFTRTAHHFAVGDMVVLTGTLGSNFTAAYPPGVIANGNQDFFVASADFTANAFTVSLTPGGSCVQSGGTFSGVSAVPDASASTIFLMNDTPLSGPAPYVLGASAENFTRSAIDSYLNILPAPGLTHSDVNLDNKPNVVGLRVNKLHVGVDIATITATLTTSADSPSGQPVENFTTGSLPASIATGMDVTSGGGCAADGYASGNLTLPVTVSSFNNTTNPSTITLSKNNFADCPTGTQISLALPWSVSSGYDLWIDGISAVGPGSQMYGAFPYGGLSSWNGGVFVSNSSSSQYDQTWTNAAYIWNATASYIGEAVFHSSQVIIDSTIHDVGTILDYTVPVISPTTNSSPVLYFGAGNVPSNIRVGWVMLSAGACNVANATVVAYNQAAGTVTMSANSPASGCGPGVNVTMGNGFHTGMWLNDGPNTNMLMDGVTYGSNLNGEGALVQDGPFTDLAIINTSFAPVGYGFTLFLQSPTTNMIIKNNSFSATTGTIDFTTSLGFTANDVYVTNNNCVQAHAFSTAASGISGIIGSGGTCW